MANNAPPPTYLYTWNTQGNFTSPTKAQEINGFLTNVGGGATPVIVFVQEGGVKKAGNGKTWAAVDGAQIGAFNERCTNYVLINTKWQDIQNAELQRLPLPTQTATKVNPTVLVGGGQAGRMPAAVAIGRLLLISWHSLAGESNEDSAAVFGAIQFNPWYKERFDRIIIGGDFNASPLSVANILNQKADKPKSYYAWVVSSGQATHPSSGQELDFFVIFDCTQALTMTAAVVPTNNVSDHEAVLTQI